jgi:hypothetical protein
MLLEGYTKPQGMTYSRMVGSTLVSEDSLFNDPCGSGPGAVAGRSVLRVRLSRPGSRNALPTLSGAEAVGGGDPPPLLVSPPTLKDPDDKQSDSVCPPL